MVDGERKCIINVHMWGGNEAMNTHSLLVVAGQLCSENHFSDENKLQKLNHLKLLLRFFNEKNPFP